MNKTLFAPAVGEQFTSMWLRKVHHKQFDMKFFTKNSHFQNEVALQTCYYPLQNKRLRDTTYREAIGFPKDKLLIGDSAGFQVASFAEKGEVCKLTPMDSLRWQEANCDIAMNLDVPPALFGKTDFGVFKDCLKKSKENFTLFQKERKNYDMKLYNVLHGDKIPLLEMWYEQVKDYNFDGWATGMKPTGDPMLQALAFMFLYEKGEYDKGKNQHFFGVSGKHVVPTMVYCGSKIKSLTTYDSSSYNTGSIFREYKMPFDIGPTLAFGDKFKTENPHIKKLPCMCPVCESIDDLQMLNEGKTILPGTLISLHNMFQYIQYNNNCNILVHDRDKYVNYLKCIGINDRTLASLDFIDFAIDKGLYNAMDKFKTYFDVQQQNEAKQVGIFNF